MTRPAPLRVLGIDPGGAGALALYTPGWKATKDAPAIPASLVIYDMPADEVTVGRSKRRRVNVLALDDLVAEMLLLGPLDKVVIEQVGGMPGQASGFAFGYGVGLLHAVFRLRRIPLEVVTPAKWKKDVKAPRDKREAVVRAEELMPQFRDQFIGTGKRGGTRPDRAEAALLAYWGATCR